MHMREVRVRPCATRGVRKQDQRVPELGTRQSAVIGLVGQPDRGRVRGVKCLEVAATATAGAARSCRDAGTPGYVSSGVEGVDPEGVARPTGQAAERVAGRGRRAERRVVLEKVVAGDADVV